MLDIGKFYDIIKIITIIIIVIRLEGFYGTVRKYSRQREALLKLLQNVKTHPDAGWLYARLKQDFPNISLATVYRNLKPAL